MRAIESTRAVQCTSSDVTLAGSLAAAAGGMLVELRGSPGLSPADLRAEGDRRSHCLLVEALRSRRPGDCILSEEGDDDAVRLEADRVWILDPVDGTREYSEGRDDWAVHVALWQRGELVAGAVALPSLGFTITTDNTTDIATAPPTVPLRLAVSRTRPPALVARLATVLPVELVPMGSAGYKAMAVVRGDVDAYVHAGGQYEWDSAAPVAVARAAGAVATRLDGSPLVYNRPDPLLPDLVVVRAELAQVLRNAIDRVLEDGA